MLSQLINYGSLLITTNSTGTGKSRRFLSRRFFLLNRKISGRFRLKSYVFSGSGFPWFNRKICRRLPVPVEPEIRVPIRGRKLKTTVIFQFLKSKIGYVFGKIFKNIAKKTFPQKYT